MMADLAAFPTGMRRTGWVLTVLMLLYPIDTFVAQRAIQQQMALDRASRQTEVDSTVVHFDLRNAAIHCGPVGWAGGWAFLIGCVWVFVSGGLWIYYRLTKRRLGESSRRAFLATVGGVIVVIAVMIFETY
jgi:hypothetical protein